MTNEQIVDLYEGLSEISQNKDLKFKAVISFVFAKNRNIIRPFYDSIIEARTKLINKYGEKNDEGILIPNEKIPQFKSEFEILMHTENYINIEEISLEDFKEEYIGIELMEKILPIIKK